MCTEFWGINSIMEERLGLSLDTFIVMIEKECVSLLACHYYYTVISCSRSLAVSCVGFAASAHENFKLPLVSQCPFLDCLWRGYFNILKIQEFSLNPVSM